MSKKFVGFMGIFKESSTGAISMRPMGLHETRNKVISAIDKTPTMTYHKCNKHCGCKNVELEDVG